MTGFYIKCTITLWMMIPGYKKEQPVQETGRCKVVVDEQYLVDTGSLGYYFVDCTEDFGWIDTSTNLKLWIPKEMCKDD